MSFLQGVTQFLESVDQKAGEISRRQDDSFGSDDERQSADDHHVADTSKDIQPPQLPHQAAPVVDGRHTPAESGKLIHSLLQAQSQLTARHEAEMLDKQSRYRELEKRFEELEGYCKDMQMSNSKLTADLDAARAACERTEQEIDALKARAAGGDEVTSKLRAEVHMITEELQRVADEKSAAASELSAAREGRRRAEAQAETIQTELNDYRRRVKLLLEEKDRRMAQLDTALSQPTPSPPLVHKPVEPSMGEQQAARMQRIAELEQQLAALTDQLSAEKTISENAKSDCAVAIEAKRLLQSQLDEAERGFEAERSSHAATRELKRQQDDEVMSLQRELKSKRASQGAQTQDAALELRVRELAEMLMEKQAALEAKRSEADQWRTRFEVSQQRLREAESIHAAVTGAGPRSAAGRSAKNLYIDEEANIAVAGDVGELGRTRFMRSLSSRGGWGEHVAVAAQGIDKVSLRTGTFLRRNAVFRVCLVIYVMLLHVWAFFVVTLAAVPSDPRHAVGPPV